MQRRMQREKQSARSAITFLIIRVHLTSRSSRLWSRDLVRKLDKLQSRLKTFTSRHRFCRSAKATCFCLVLLHRSEHHPPACLKSFNAHLIGVHAERLITISTANKTEKNGDAEETYSHCLTQFGSRFIVLYMK